MTARKNFNNSSKKNKGTIIASTILAATLVTSGFVINNKIQEAKSGKARGGEVSTVCYKSTSIQFQKSAGKAILKPASSYKTSQKGAEVIMQFEGFVDHAYTDVNKKAIGFGHNIKKGEKFPAKITMAQAKKLLMKDLKINEAAVKNAVKVKITQEHLDAIVSFSYNVGPENFRTSTMLKHLNSGNFEKAGKEFDEWVFITGKNGVCKKSEGLQDRRNAEQALFVKGNKKVKQFI